MKKTKTAKPKKQKKLKLSKQEKNILLYPPTTTTWLCAKGTEYIHINAGSADRCLWCGEAKPESPKLLWPTYLKACEKVDVEPGTLWKQVSDKTILIKRKDEPWKVLGAETPTAANKEEKRKVRRKK